MLVHDWNYDCLAVQGIITEKFTTSGDVSFALGLFNYDIINIDILPTYKAMLTDKKVYTTSYVVNDKLVLCNFYHDLSGKTICLKSMYIWIQSIKNGIRIK